MMKQMLMASALASVVMVTACEEKKAEPAPKATMGDAAKSMGDAATSAGTAVKEGAAAATDAVKEQAGKLQDAYRTEVDRLATMLSEIKTKADAEAKKVDVSKAVDAVNAAAASAGSMAADAKESMKTHLAKVREQITRLTADADISGVLGEKLKSLKLAE
jgi:hypothetical protein